MTNVHRTSTAAAAAVTLLFRNANNQIAQRARQQPGWNSPRRENYTPLKHPYRGYWPDHSHCSGAKSRRLWSFHASSQPNVVQSLRSARVPPWSGDRWRRINRNPNCRFLSATTASPADVVTSPTSFLARTSSLPMRSACHVTPCPRTRYTCERTTAWNQLIYEACMNKWRAESTWTDIRC
jgi:hypothetical protein